LIEATASVEWDHHANLKSEMKQGGQATDQLIAALLEDLEQRSLLDDQFVIWSGKFGRTPYAQASDGQDHNNLGLTVWMAGAGVRLG